MQAHHRVTSLPPALEVKHLIDGCVVNVRHEDLHDPIFPAALHHVLAVAVELFCVNVRVCVYPVIHELLEVERKYRILAANWEIYPRALECRLLRQAISFDVLGGNRYAGRKYYSP